MSTRASRIGDPDHLKVFANEAAAETWLQENDPEGVAFELKSWSELPRAQRQHRMLLIVALRV